jgi:hypothetical protein
MSDIQPIDLGRDNTLTQGEFLAGSAIALFYTFATRCLDWAATTRSLWQRAHYMQMGLQWLVVGARLQTFVQVAKRDDCP